MGIIANAMNPSSEFPHPNPRAEYKGGAAKGRKAPNRDRRIVFAASAEAEYTVKASMRYVEIGNW
jgi:hypothetical protein